MIEKELLTESELDQNYNEFIEIVKTSFTGDRREKLLELYKEENYGLRLATAPASGRARYHLAQDGGYLLHVYHVIKASKMQEIVFQKMGGIVDWTEEERIFAAMHHDLGKLGDDTGEYYQEQDEDWKRKRGEIYKFNPRLQYMDVTDRAIYVLQSQHIDFTWKEMLGMKLADGLYHESCAEYLKQFDGDKRLKTNLPHIIHWADNCSCVSEYSVWYDKNK